jgi:hypothetical protein
VEVTCGYSPLYGKSHASNITATRSSYFERLTKQNKDVQGSILLGMAWASSLLVGRCGLDSLLFKIKHIQYRFHVQPAK